MEHVTDSMTSPPRNDRGFAGADFFFSNLRMQENLSTIRHGVETHRGLIIITGEPGSGKTKLLSRSVAEMPAHVTCIELPAGMLGFADALRFMLRHLDAADDPAIAGENEASLARRCQALARAHLERDQLIALAVDDAHLLPERTLRNLIHNFLGGSAEAPDGALIQLILTGGGLLKTRLAQAVPVPLRRRRPVVCEVQTLSSQEIGAYIQQGLRAADRPADLFDERAVKRVALLSQGNPRNIGALCARALKIGGTAARITADMVEAGAQALNFRSAAPLRTASASDNFGITEERNGRVEKNGDFGAPDRTFADEPAADEPALFEFGQDQPRGWLPRSERLTFWVRGAGLVIVLLAAAAIIPAQAAINLLTDWRTQAAINLTDWRTKLSQLAASEFAAWRPESHPRSTENRAETGGTRDTVKDSDDRLPLVPVPGPDRPATSVEHEMPAGRESATATGEQSQAVERRKPSGGAPRAKQSSEASTRRAPPKEQPNANRDLQVEVSKAIASRAIMGVAVSVVDGTAILDGRVASERQRRAAERAALSVSGVERVRNRISITVG